MKNLGASLFATAILLATFPLSGCFNSNSAPPILITLSSSPSPATVQQGQTATITATVANDTSNRGVAWSLNGQGTLSNSTMTSVTYTAPASVSANLTATVTATLVANSSISTPLTITVTPPPPISVSIINKVTVMAAVPGPVFTSFTAVVQNDPSSGGVSWALTAGGSSCAPACGTLGAKFDDQNTVSYNPPSIVPAGSNATPTITATSVTDPTKSDTDTFTIIDGSTACGTGGNESALKGEYAILLQGFIGSGAGTPVTISGSFAADGTGKITSGVKDTNGFSMGISVSPINQAGSGYSVAPDNRGCLTLTDAFKNTTLTFRFTLGSINGGIASKGDIIEFDDKTGTEERASGILRLQDPAAFSLSALQPNYAVGLDGWDTPTGALSHFAMVGSFSQNAGAISGISFDANDGGTMTLENSNTATGTIQPISTTYGRSTATLFAPIASGRANVVIYVVNSSEILINSMDINLGVGHAGSNPVFSGRAIATGGSFSQTSASPNYIFRTSGNSSGSSSVSIGLASFSGGTATLTTDQFVGGVASSQNITGSYTVGTPSGRIPIITGSNTPLILYLTNPVDGISAFSIGTDASASLGVFDAQPVGPFDSGSLSGNFILGSSDPGDSTISNFAGVLSVAAGTGSGTEDVSGSTGLSLASPVNLPLSIQADGSGNVGVKTVAVTNGTVLYYIDENGSSGNVGVVEP